MPRFEAASISITSSELPAAISLHESHSPRPRKNVGVCHTVILDRVLQGFGYVLLADEIVERLRAPLAGYDLIAHGKVLSRQFSVFSKQKNLAHITALLPLKTVNWLLKTVSVRGTSGDLGHPR